MKSGRPRRYDISPPDGFAHPTVGAFAASLEELGLRFLDLICDLPKKAMVFLPEGGANSISMLGVNMIWAEAAWVSRIAGAEVSTEVDELVGRGRQGPDGTVPESTFSPKELEERWHAVHRGMTRPLLSGVTDPDSPVAGAAMTNLQALMHLSWHWSYHSGQVGILRRLWGAGYRWTFAT